MTQTMYLDLKDSPCFEWDNYLQDIYEGTTIWTVTLNNGQKVYQDDGRPGSINAWPRLKTYCQANNLYIIDFKISFRNCHHNLQSGASGYYFVNSAGILYGMTKTFLYYVVGVVREGIIHVERVKIPELMVEETEFRPIIGNEECLIMRPSNLQS